MSRVTGIDVLLARGLATEFQLEQLKKHHIVTMPDIAMTAIHKLSQIPGISPQEAMIMVREASRYIRVDYRSAADVAESQSTYFSLSLGSSDLDKLVGNNGLDQSMLYEISGEGGSGKTSICHQLAVTTQLPVFAGGAAAKVAFIDCCKTFRPERICSIAKRYGLDEHVVLANIRVARCHNVQHLYNLLAEAKALFMEERYGLLAIDNITSLIRAEFGVGDGFIRQRTLAELMQNLRLIIAQFSIVVVYTVEMVANFGGIPGESDNIPAGGSVVAYYGNSRLLLRRHFTGVRSAELLKSDHMPTGRVYFRLAHDGIHDV